MVTNINSSSERTMSSGSELLKERSGDLLHFPSCIFKLQLCGQEAFQIGFYYFYFLRDNFTVTVCHSQHPMESYKLQIKVTMCCEGPERRFGFLDGLDQVIPFYHLLQNNPVQLYFQVQENLEVMTRTLRNWVHRQNCKRPGSYTENFRTRIIHWELYQLNTALLAFPLLFLRCNLLLKSQ